MPNAMRHTAGGAAYPRAARLHSSPSRNGFFSLTVLRGWIGAPARRAGHADAPAASRRAHHPVDKCIDACLAHPPRQVHIRTGTITRKHSARAAFMAAIGFATSLALR
jgi:hypothetical protein